MMRLSIRPQCDFDIAVVGAGPAGAAAAAHLARSGLRVGLLDAWAFPRDKVCGDFVSPVGLMELNRLGVTRLPGFRRSNPIHRAAVFVDGQELITSPIPEVAGLPSHGRVVPRKVLDDWILGVARDAGAKLLEGFRVRHFEVTADCVTLTADSPAGTRNLCARALVGADGSNSLVARLVRGRPVPDEDRIIAVRAYFEGVDGPADQADLYFTGASFPGYYWLFPTGPSTANVGVGMVLETLPRTAEHLRALLSRLIESDAALSARLRRATLVDKVVGWPLTTYSPGLQIIGERLLLVGDAAGLINPLNGEGIQYALLSARWAADTLVACAGRDDFSRSALEPYAARVHGAVRYDMALAAMIVQLIRNRSLNPLWLQALKVIIARARVDPSYADLTGGVLAGLVPAASVISGKIVVDTLKQAAISSGFGLASRALRGPQQIARLGTDLGSLVGDALVTALRNPGEFLMWCVAVGTSGVELAGQIARHAIAPRRDGAGPGEHATALRLVVQQ